MAYLIPEYIIEEASVIEREAESVLQRIYGDGVGLFELMETMPKDKRDDLDNRLVRLIQSDGSKEILALLQRAAEACVRSNS